MNICLSINELQLHHTPEIAFVSYYNDYCIANTFYFTVCVLFSNNGIKTLFKQMYYEVITGLVLRENIFKGHILCLN